MERRKSGLLIPTRMNEEPRFVCRLPGCGWKGYSQQEMTSHAMHHATHDEDLIREDMREPMDEILGEGDPERQAYLERRYRQLKGKVADPLSPDHY